MCRADYSDPPEVYTEKAIKRARKRHECGECGRYIELGEPYHRAFTVYEGFASTYTTCAHCKVGQRWLSKQCGGWVFSQVGEELLEHAEEYPAVADKLRAFVAKMDRKWRRWATRPDLLTIPAALPPITLEH